MIEASYCRDFSRSGNAQLANCQLVDRAAQAEVP